MGFFYNNSEVIEDEDEKKRIEDLAKAEEEQAEKEKRSISATYERTGICQKNTS